MEHVKLDFALITLEEYDEFVDHMQRNRYPRAVRSVVNAITAWPYDTPLGETESLSLTQVLPLAKAITTAANKLLIRREPVPGYEFNLNGWTQTQYDEWMDAAQTRNYAVFAALIPLILVKSPLHENSYSSDEGIRSMSLEDFADMSSALAYTVYQSFSQGN